ncbi:MAG: tetratricopeptide repeat protein [Alphaproteobacteria bacterium]|nr:tetratricopeptide repeat protein [Alphaproteobacteria bacterium]
MSVLDQAIAAHRAGRMDEAERLYRQVIAEEPNNPDALALLGVALGADGVEFIEKAISLDPNAALFRFYLGNALVAAGNNEQAIEAFRQATVLQPRMHEAFYNLGNALHEVGKCQEAGEAYAKTLQLVPNHYLARNNFALMCEIDGKLEDALIELEQVVKEQPGYIDGLLNLCRVAELKGDYAKSLAVAQQAVNLAPNNPSAYLGLGVALNRLERNEEALVSYKKALEIRSDWVEIWDNIGQTYQFLNRLDEAKEAFLKTIEFSGQKIPDEDERLVDEREYGSRHWHLALLELLMGDYKKGFTRYRARFEDLKIKRPPYKKPLWQGESLSGKTILIGDEQGMGDCIMFARYLPLIKSEGGRVKFIVNPALVPLFQNWSGADEVIPRGRAPGEFDFHASIFDLPYCFGTTLETVPANVPYLPSMEADENTRLEKNGNFKIGITWAGAPKHKQDMRRSIPLKLFEKLFDENGVAFFSLNRDMRPGDDALLAAHPSVTDLAPRLNDFGDAARFISQLDLIITCDTATAHLAGAMGKRVWTLLPFSPDWRWLKDREDSPWYPTMRLFRQRKIGDWEDVIERVLQSIRTIKNYP